MALQRLPRLFDEVEVSKSPTWMLLPVSGVEVGVGVDVGSGVDVGAMVDVGVGEGVLL